MSNILDFEMYFYVFGVLCIVSCLSDSLSFSVYMEIFCGFFILLEKCPRSVRNSRTDYFLRLGGIWGALIGHPSPPSPASMSKIPSGGKNMERKCFFSDLL